MSPCTSTIIDPILHQRLQIHGLSSSERSNSKEGYFVQAVEEDGYNYSSAITVGKKRKQMVRLWSNYKRRWLF